MGRLGLAEGRACSSRKEEAKLYQLGKGLESFLVRAQESFKGLKKNNCLRKVEVKDSVTSQ